MIADESIVYLLPFCLTPESPVMLVQEFHEIPLLDFQFHKTLLHLVEVQKFRDQSLELQTVPVYPGHCVVRLCPLLPGHE